MAIGWRWLINNGARVIVLHDSLLPRYRGFAPLVNSLINGETKIGVTALFASEKGYDAGAIISQRSIDIIPPLAIDTAIKLVGKLYSEQLVSIVSSDELRSMPQDESQATYSPWRDENDYWIDWAQSAEKTHRTILALGYPYKGAKTHLNGNVVTLGSAEVVQDVVVEDRASHVGKVLFTQCDLPVVICGTGLLRVNCAVDKFRSRFS